MQAGVAGSSIADNNATEIHNVLTLVGITILYYDYMITFKREYLYIWRSWRSLHSKASICLLLTRYFALVTAITAAYGISPTQSRSKTSCHRLAVCHQVALIITQMLVAVTQFMRTYALYSKSKQIVAFLVMSTLVAIAVNAWAMIRQPGDTLVWQQGCYLASSSTSAMRTAAQWETALAYDAMILLLTLFKTYDWRTHLKYGSARPPDTISLVYKYGAIYFGAIVLAHGTNVATFYALPQPSLRGSLSTAASAISVSMMSRLTLDLHSRALRRHNNMTSLLPSSVTASSTTRNFELTSQISVAESDEDAFDNDLEWDEDE